ncbi:MAG TPA: DMT family transporter [Lacibacter sp.]|nr:DMT family transporter [Lacibacter sp.]HMO90071.1 DMT family transporter [Lacibacter sp.]
MKGSRQVYAGVLYMLLAALGFSVMGGAAKSLRHVFNAGQLVFWRNLIGLAFLLPGLLLRPPVQVGGHPFRLLFRGVMGTTALYTLLYCILHIPLGTAMSYNLTSTLFIALFSFLLFREQSGRRVWLALLVGFTGMLLIYQPQMDLPWYQHLAGLISGITSAIAYLTVGRLTAYYDTRVIVLSFIATGLAVPLLFMGAGTLLALPPDELLFIEWKWPEGADWGPLLLLGTAALFGQYFVTRAYGADKAGIVSVVGYANILFSVFIGMALGDAFPAALTWLGIGCIIGSGVLISLEKRRQRATAS